MLVVYILPVYKKHQHETVQIVSTATKQLPRCINSLQILSYVQQRPREHFHLLLLLSRNFNNFNNFVNSASTRLRIMKMIQMY